MDEPAQALDRFNQVEHERRPQMQQAPADGLEVERKRYRHGREAQRGQSLLHGVDLDQDVLLVGRRIGGHGAVDHGNAGRTARSYGNDHDAYSAAIETPAPPQRRRADSTMRPINAS